MYVIFLLVLGLLSPLPFVTPFSYDFMSDNDMENVRYGPTDMQRGFDHGIKNSMMNAYAQTANSTQVTFIDIKTLKNNYTANETIITIITSNSSDSISYKIENPDGNIVLVGQVNHVSNGPTVLVIDIGDSNWHSSGIYNISVRQGNNQASTSIMFNASSQMPKPITKTVGPFDT